MNRRERRLMSKRLGIMEYQKKLPFNKRQDLIHENIIAGKQVEKETKERIEREQKQQLDEKASKTIQFLADGIAKREKLPMAAALEIAEKEYNQSQNKK